MFNGLTVENEAHFVCIIGFSNGMLVKKLCEVVFQNTPQRNHPVVVVAVTAVTHTEASSVTNTLLKESIPHMMCVVANITPDQTAMQLRDMGQRKYVVYL